MCNTAGQTTNNATDERSLKYQCVNCWLLCIINLSNFIATDSLKSLCGAFENCIATHPSCHTIAYTAFNGLSENPTRSLIEPIHYSQSRNRIHDAN